MSPPGPALFTPSEMARADAAAAALGMGTDQLMHNAGRAVARAIAARMRPCPTLVLCGPGNNGGDGYVAARILAERGWPVSVAALAPPRASTPAARAAARWRGPMRPFAPGAETLVIDAVFGAGLSRDVDPLVADTLRAAGRVVAVDMPSGIDGADGQIRGDVRAAVLTVTFARAKPGHWLLPGRDLCGELVVADIGLPAAALAAARPDTFLNGPALWSVPHPAAAGHKYTRGHVTVLGGAAMTGAARLAADGARRAGAGLVTIAAMGGAETYRAGAPGVIVDDAPLSDQLADARRSVWVCGPGLGALQARAALPALIAAGRRVVADADSFSACAGDPDALRGAAVITPHAGEFSRVFGPLRADRVSAARDAARRTGAVVVLKGSDTLIASPDGRVAINGSAPPCLATAGAGDVLAGLVAGLLAQGMPAWDAAAAAVWLHGEAASVAGPGLIVEDLGPAMPAALARAWSDGV